MTPEGQFAQETWRIFRIMAEFVEGFGTNFHYHFHATEDKSPIIALNQQLEECQSELVMVTPANTLA